MIIDDDKVPYLSSYTLLSHKVRGLAWHLMSGSEVNKPSKYLTKTSNGVEYIESDIQNIEAPIIDDPII